MIDRETIEIFLKRLGHPVMLKGRKPATAHAPKSTILFPSEQSDTVGEAAELAKQYHAVYVNLNPLLEEYVEGVPYKCPNDGGGKMSVRDCMIARRTRLLVDVDGHDVPKEVARQQKDAIKAKLGEPLIETDSGNGYGLIYAIDLPNEEQSTSLIKRVLAGLKKDFDCVDTSCANAGRLTRVIGTLNVSADGIRIPTRLLNAIT